MTDADLPPLRDVIKAHGLGALKRFGQHFLLDSNLCGRIARVAGVTEGAHVVEVGPGPGGLTRALLAQGATVWAVEMDRRCLPALADLGAAYPGRLEVVEGDALETDIPALAPAPRRIVSNLPYNVSTPLMLRWLREVREYESLTLMFQKEVADRLTAAPGTKAYGRLTVMTTWLCEVRYDFNVDCRAFTPPPKVASTVVTLLPRPQPLAEASWESLERVTAAAFGQRRKMLRQSLKPLGLADRLEDLGLDPTARAETLPVEAFCALARAL